MAKAWASDFLPSLAAICSLTARTNDGASTATGLTVTLNAAECLLLGADFGVARADGGADFTCEFSALPNKTGLSVGDIGGIGRKG